MVCLVVLKRVTSVVTDRTPILCTLSSIVVRISVAWVFPPPAARFIATVSRKGLSLADPHYRPFVPYTGRRRTVRWPWTIATLILLSIVGMTGLLVAGNLRADTPNVIGLAGTPAGTDVAQVMTQPAATQLPATETVVPTATAIDTNAPVRVAENWLAAWETADYDGMYNMTSSATQKSITREAFVERYSGIVTKAGLTSVKANITGDPGLDGKVPYTITLKSSLVGDITENNAIPVTKDGNDWKVAWAPSLIFRDLGAESCIDFSGMTLTRGKILDRNGKVLAEDKVFAQVGVIPGQVKSDQTYEDLSQLINMPVADIKAAVKGQGENWIVALKNMPEDKSTDLLNAVPNIPGATVNRTTARSYPYGAVAAHVTGWVSKANAEDIKNDTTGSTQADKMVGRSGLEYGANDLLAGKPGGELEVVDCTSRAIDKVIAKTEGTPSQSIYLTIDIDFQKQVDQALTDTKGTTRGAAVILDPQTGAVLAMVSHPSFDPNGYVTGNFSAADQTALNDATLRASANRATHELYPTGSIFKVITTAAAMKDLNYNADTPIDCPASFSIGNQTWDDWVVENGLSAQGMLTLHSGLVQSCNSVFYQIGAALDKVDPKDLPGMAKAFGLGALTGIPDFPELGGTIPDPTWKQENIGDGWSTGDSVNMAIGQGYVQATPLQMANVYATIANGGTLLQPYIVDRTQADGDTATKQVGVRKEIGKVPLTTDQMSQLQDMLRDQTSNDQNVGSAKVFADFAWDISGKTGTAENNIDGTDKPHSWFAAYGPGTNGEPTIASCVMFENMGEGVSYAAPATKEIYQDYIKSNLSKRKP